jgi:DNA-binding winged helix-turn-helix (wHTH) protein/tetratricopeptide (TPR) repeat protein/TolB-like protein
MSHPPEPDASVFAYCFDRFELRPRSRELLRDGQPVELQGKVFDLIEYLVRHAERVVDKNELLDAVWPRQVVTEAALSRAVMKARRALGDDGSNPKLLQTVHGRGLRLLVAVERIVAAEPAATAAPRTTPTAPAQGTGAEALRRAPAMVWARVIGIGLLIVLAFGSWLGRDGESARNAAQPLRIAVLPVTNATGDPTLDWTRIALMGSIAELLRVGESVPVLAAVDLLPHDDALSALAPEERLRRLRDAHGVSHVVEGRLERQPGQLRMSYQLLGDEQRIRRRTVVASDVAGIAHAVGADVRAVLGLRRRGAQVSEDEFANEAYLRGQAMRLQGDLHGALEFFRLAAEQAPQAFWPRFELATALRDLGDLAAARSALEALRDEADANGTLSARIDTRTALAFVGWRSGAHAEARTLLEQALELATASAEHDRIGSVHAHLGTLASVLGDLPLARTHYAEAMRHELAHGQERPSGALLLSLARVEGRDGETTAAAAYLDQALLQFRLLGDRGNEASALLVMAMLRHTQGKYLVSRELAEQALAALRAGGNRSHESSALYTLAVAEAELGRLSAAIEQVGASLTLAQALGEAPRVTQARALLAQFQRDLGQFDSARSSFAQAAQEYAEQGDARQVERQQLYLAQVEMLAGNLDLAEAQARNLLAELDPASTHRPQLLRLLAQIRLAQADPDGAAAWLVEAEAALGDRRRGRAWAWLRLLVAEQAIAAGDPARAEQALADAESELAGRHEFLRVAAELAASTGAPARALELERAAREAAGERWRPADQQRLQARERAVGAAHAED